MSEAYRVHRLTKIYAGASSRANDEIDLSIPQGQLLGVFGPNGAGKTTLLRQLVGLLAPTRGAIELLGRDVVRDPAFVAWFVAYFGQRPAALRNHTLREVVMITGVLRGLPARSAGIEADELIERFQLNTLAQRRLGTLSGGEQRLALLAAAFVGDRPILVLDEPTNEIDPVRRRAVWDHLRALHAAGRTILLATHNLAEAEFAVDHVLVIDRGRIVASGTPGELKRAVSDHVRLEIRLREGARSEAEERLERLASARRIEAGHWEIVTTYGRSVELLPTLVGLLGPDAVDDFRLVTPSLEDVYVATTGQEWERARS